jgi:hypothetical protein
LIAYALPTVLDYAGCEISLNLAFDVVLRVFDLYRDKELDEEQKLNAAFEMLTIEPPAFSASQKAEIIERVFADFITVKSKPVANPRRLYDFLQDGKYIYSSFMQDYGIDLIEQQGKLDWRKFIALFDGLSSKTKMSEVISIRAAEIPTGTVSAEQARAEQARKLREAKAYYALDVSEEEAEEQFQLGLERLADALQQRASNG